MSAIKVNKANIEFSSFRGKMLCNMERSDLLMVIKDLSQQLDEQRKSTKHYINLLRV